MYLLIELSIKTEGITFDLFIEKMSFLCSTRNDILSDLGSSPGFSGHFPGHFAALPRKSKVAVEQICSHTVSKQYSCGCYLAESGPPHICFFFVGN